MLENRVVRRIGGTANIPVDIRIIAATNRDLRKAMEEKHFREDLYYRLKVFQITLPALRERPEDIPIIADHFIKFFNHQFQKNVSKLSDSIKNILINYNWPGNVRELSNVMERAVILETTVALQPDNLPIEIVSSEEDSVEFHIPNDQLTVNNLENQPLSAINFPTEGISLYEFEKQLIVMALQRTGNNQTKTSKLLQISRDTLRYKMKKYNL